MRFADRHHLSTAAPPKRRAPAIECSVFVKPGSLGSLYGLCQSIQLFGLRQVELDSEFLPPPARLPL
jgi:hypothetical protein